MKTRKEKISNWTIFVEPQIASEYVIALFGISAHANTLASYERDSRGYFNLHIDHDGEEFGTKRGAENHAKRIICMVADHRARSGAAALGLWALVTVTSR